LNRDLDNKSRVVALQGDILRAFPDVTYTGKVTRFDGAWLPDLTEENALLDDDKFLYEELYGRKWSDVSQEFVRKMPGEFVLLTKQALVAFLAAWLMCSLEDMNGENSVREGLVFTFAPGEDPRLTDFVRDQLQALNSEQRSVVRSLLAEFSRSEGSEFVRERASQAVKLIDNLM
jgi:hypothetical protein